LHDDIFGEFVNPIGQIEALQNILQNIAFCTTPFIFSENELLSTREVTEFVIEPLLSVTIDGCRLGAAPGQVRLIFPSTGETFTLKVPLAHWRDDSIHAILPAQSGRLDQPAQLIVITADGVQTPPLDLQFRATREWTFVDPVAHPNVLFVDCGHNTTTDTCQAVAHEGPPPTLFVAAEGKHFTFCCSSVSGTDRWGLSLNNGWTLMSLVENSDVVSSPDIPQVSFSFAAEGYTTCNFFNRDGRITDYRELASSDPRIQGEVHISWWVDHSCSGIEYAANISIIGPSGVPYCDKALLLERRRSQHEVMGLIDSACIFALCTASEYARYIPWVRFPSALSNPHSAALVDCLLIMTAKNCRPT
jgi:hypothetical protein